MTKYIRKRPLWSKWGSIALVVLVALGGLGVGAFLYTTQLFQEELTDSLILGCQQNGNPLREAEVEDLQEGIEDLEESIISPDDPRIARLFPNVPRQFAEEIIVEGNQKARAKILKKQSRIPKVKPINCVEHYPDH